MAPGVNKSASHIISPQAFKNILLLKYFSYFNIYMHGSETIKCAVFLVIERHVF